MRSVNEEGRLRIIEMMWELVYADGQVSEFEDNVVWRAADLLGISSRDRIDLKHKVAEQRQPASSAGCRRRPTRRRDDGRRDTYRSAVTADDETLMCGRIGRE